MNRSPSPALSPNEGRRGERDGAREGATWWLGLSVFALSLLFISGCFQSRYAVTRVVDGREVTGPYIGDKSYAHYLRGAILEAEGQYAEALAAYRLARRYGPQSADIWTRIASVQCALGKDPWSAFERAISIDPRYEGAFMARAHCHIRREELDAALEAARMAASLEPQTTANIVFYAYLLNQKGKSEEARAFLDELVIREPKSIEAHRARLELALATGDPRRSEASAKRLLDLAPNLSQELGKEIPSLSPLARIDAALLRQDLELARSLAISERIPPGTLALRAALLGRITEAGEEAKLALSANPADSDARVAAAFVAQLQRDDAALSAALADLPADVESLSALGIEVLEKLVRGRVGEGILGR